MNRKQLVTLIEKELRRSLKQNLTKRKGIKRVSGKGNKQSHRILPTNSTNTIN